MKILFLLTISLYRLIIELVFFLSRPILWLILPFYRYGDALKAPVTRDDHPILIHCASVGELNAIRPVLSLLMKSNYPLYLNTMTVTARDIARCSFPGIPVDLAPLDVASLRKKQLQAISPKMILIVETEIWPMLLVCAASMNVPVLFINARMSEKSLKAYVRIRGLLRYLARGVRQVMAQSEDDKQRFQVLFGQDVLNAGNLKYCLTLPAYDADEVLANMGFIARDRILVWGSSRPGEEALILSLFSDLKKSFKDLKLIIAPRHPKRSQEVEKLLEAYAYSKLSDPMNKSFRDILLIDSLGYLSQAYAIASIAIVGGSFYDFGGHNPLEPAFYGKPVIIGPYHYSCKASVKKLKENDAIIVSDSANLRQDISNLLQNVQLREEMGKRARIVLTENAHALENHMRGIKQWL